MANTKIKNIEDLRVQIAFLRIQRAEQEIFLNNTVTKASRVFNGPINFIKSALSFLGLRDQKNNQGTGEADWATNIARLAIPFFLNKTILGRSGFVLKTAISLLSQNFINAKNFNKSTIASWIDKITDWVDSTTCKKRIKEEIDYGISPESETYSGKPIH